MGIKKFFGAVRDAWHGICDAVELGRNIRIELLAAAWALLLVWTSGYGKWYYIAMLGVCALVLGAECMNTAVEKLCDRVTSERDELIRKVKDMAAGAVLICAVVALCVALFLFVDLDFWKAVLHNIGDNKGWAAVALVVIPIGAFVMAFLPPKAEDKHEDEPAEESEEKTEESPENGEDKEDGDN